VFLEFSQFIGRVPKESYDLLRRNIEIRKVLEKIYRDYKAGIEINPADFDFIFDEIFRYFFRPLELAIANTMLFSFLLPDRKNIRLLESFSEVFQNFQILLQTSGACNCKYDALFIFAAGQEKYKIARIVQ